MRQTLKGSEFPEWKMITCLPEREPALLSIPTFLSVPGEQLYYSKQKLESFYYLLLQGCK